MTAKQWQRFLIVAFLIALVAYAIVRTIGVDMSDPSKHWYVFFGIVGFLGAALYEFILKLCNKA